MKQLASSFKLAGFVIALFGLLAISSGLAYGQAIDGNVVGTIVDSQGAAVARADVTAPTSPPTSWPPPRPMVRANIVSITC